MRDKGLFKELDESIEGTVMFGDHSRVPVKGEGNDGLPSQDSD